MRMIAFMHAVISGGPCWCGCPRDAHRHCYPSMRYCGGCECNEYRRQGLWARWLDRFRQRPLSDFSPRTARRMLAAIWGDLYGIEVNADGTAWAAERYEDGGYICAGDPDNLHALLMIDLKKIRQLTDVSAPAAGLPSRHAPP